VNAIRRVMMRANVDESLADFGGNIISAALTIVVIIAALEQLGVDTTSVLAVFAAAGLAVGLALKDSLSNFSAGVMLILFKPFKIGDVITAAGSTGVVESIRIFNTLMRTGDNQEITIPNSHIYGGSIINITTRETRRIDLVIGIGYDDNIGKAKEIIDGIISKHELILEDPAPTIMVLELGESSIDIAVRPWVKTGDYWAVRADLLQTIKETFDEQGISIPYPQRDLHVIDMPTAKSA
jgi:small conductance mechanosensitive channel